MASLGRENLSGSGQHIYPRETAPAERESRHKGKDEFARESVVLTMPEFIEKRVLPLVRGCENLHGADCRATVLQNSNTGRLTLRYELGPEVILFATHTGELGAHIYRVMNALRNNGFGPASAYQVSEPVGFFPDLSLLFVRQAAGAPVMAALEADSPVDLGVVCRKAARWLAALHRSPIRIGTPETDWGSLKMFRLTSQVIKAAAARPEDVDLMLDLLDAVEDRVTHLRDDRPTVQTHGRYHHGHLYVSAASVVATDLDRSRPSDPAKDVAEFLCVLRLEAFKKRFDAVRMEEATRTFLDEYIERVPETVESLGCYWGVSVFHKLLGTLNECRNGDRDQGTWKELVDFYVLELRRALAFGL